MASAELITTSGWTAVDIVNRFGAIPIGRVVLEPVPGQATVEDVSRLEAGDNALCELVDGTLVRKTVGALESYLAVRLATLLNAIVMPGRLGIVLGPDGTLQLGPRQVRIPDVCFASWQRVAGSGFGTQPVPTLVPEFAVEILSAGNTHEEMQRKLHDYFAAGVQVVWYVDVRRKSVRVFASPTDFQELTGNDRLELRELIPGFSVTVSELLSVDAP